MKKATGHLRNLIAAFGGKLPAEPEWHSLIELANRGWLVPALYVALRQKDCLDRLPEEVRDYLELLHGRNYDRNQRLKAQLVEATRALNRAGIQPILLKGAIRLFTAPDETIGARMLSDLDLNVGSIEAAAAALAPLGYHSQAIPRELGRSQDAAEIELHDRPSRRSAGYLSGDLASASPLVETDGAVAAVPDPTAQALHLIVHDMIKEGDYWRLRIDLRHLHDLAILANAPEGLDWNRLREALSTNPGRQALRLQARALADLYGIEVPADLLRSSRARIRHAMRLAATERSLAGRMSRAAGNLSWGLHRLADDHSFEGAGSLFQRAYDVFSRPATGSRL